MIANLPEGVRARLQKIARLAESGVSGERENAARMLAALCREHNVDPATLMSAEKKQYRIGVNTAREFEIFKQCYAFVMRVDTIRYADAFKAVHVTLSEVDMIDLRACFKHYKKAYAAAEEEFYSAFIQKHKLYGPSDPTERDENPPMDAERLARMLAMMKSMRSDNWTRPVAALQP